MNLKERGITVGDILLVFILVITTIILFKAFKNDKKTTLNINHQEKILYSENHLNNLSI